MLDPKLTTFVVIAHGQRLDWVESLRQKGFPVEVIHKGDIIPNIGKEEFGYASFIIDNYDSLKNDYVFCHHDILLHVCKHMNPPVPKDGLMNKLWEKIDYSKNGRFCNFGNYFIATDPIEMKSMLDIYRKLLDKDPPSVLISCQGAQHMVSAERIQSYNLGWWKDFQDYVIELDRRKKQSHHLKVNVGEIFCRLWEELYIPEEIASIRGNMTPEECKVWLVNNSDGLTKEGITYMPKE